MIQEIPSMSWSEASLKISAPGLQELRCTIPDRLNALCLVVKVDCFFESGTSEASDQEPGANERISISLMGMAYDPDDISGWWREAKLPRSEGDIGGFLANISDANPTTNTLFFPGMTLPTARILASTISKRVREGMDPKHAIVEGLEGSRKVIPAFGPNPFNPQ